MPKQPLAPRPTAFTREKDRPCRGIALLESGILFKAPATAAK